LWLLNEMKIMQMTTTKNSPMWKLITMVHNNLNK